MDCNNISSAFRHSVLSFLTFLFKQSSGLQAELHLRKLIQLLMWNSFVRRHHFQKIRYFSLRYEVLFPTFLAWTGRMVDSSLMCACSMSPVGCASYYFTQQPLTVISNRGRDVPLLLYLCIQTWFPDSNVPKSKHCYTFDIV